MYKDAIDQMRKDLEDRERALLSKRQRQAALTRERAAAAAATSPAKLAGDDQGDGGQLPAVAGEGQQTPGS